MSKSRIGSWVLALGFLATGAFAQQKVYWVGIRTVYRANLDGSNIETLVVMPSGNGFADIEIDTFRGKMYWSNPGDDKIHRANLDGSELEVVVDLGTESPIGLAIDSDAAKLYWTNGDGWSIERSNLDGTQRESIISTPFPVALALDVEDKHIYWATGGDQLMRGDFDGGNIVELYDFDPTFLDFRGLALDLQRGKIYCGLNDNMNINDPGSLVRTELDGSSFQEIVSNMLVNDIVIDATGGKIYWSAGGLLRADINSSGVEVVFDPGDGYNDDFRGFALDFLSPPEAGIPAVSEWGLVVMAFLLLAVGTICLQQRRREAAFYSGKKRGRWENFLAFGYRGG